jgi:hypothetical protein
MPILSLTHPIHAPHPMLRLFSYYLSTYTQLFEVVSPSLHLLIIMCAACPTHLTLDFITLRVQILKVIA